MSSLVRHPLFIAVAAGWIVQLGELIYVFLRRRPKRKADWEKLSKF